MPLSVCIPTYRGLDLIDATLATILAQDYHDFEVVICNDSPDDHAAMAAKIAAYRDPRLRFFANEVNLGYPCNLRKCTQLASHDILFLMGQDDLLLGEDVFRRVVDILNADPRIGCITRPYYWFHDAPRTPIRMVPKYHARIIDIRTDPAGLHAILETVGQLSALVYRRSLITEPFDSNVFTAHIYPFLSILKTHTCYYWPDFNLAVRTLSSQTRFLSSIYRPSPTKTWVEMCRRVFREPEFAAVRKATAKQAARNFVGLVQIRNYGHLIDFFADARYLVRYRPLNLLAPRFLCVFLGCALTPRPVLRWLVDAYKCQCLRRRYGTLLDGTPGVAVRKEHI
ncbi:MAG: glycosyltransferase [bacterium]